MNVAKWKTLGAMALDPKVVKSVWEMYNILKDDENFTLGKYIKMMSSILEGEKIVPFEDQYVISPFLPPFPSKAFMGNIKAVDCPQNIFTQQIYAKRSAPISIYLSLTHRCPNNCVYCSAKGGSNQGELTREQWTTVIKDLQDMGTPIIGLTGGEPMVREDINEIVRAIDDRSVSTLFTSGVYLTLDRAKALKDNGLFSIGISLDSHDRDKHNANRNDPQAFDYALTALENARKAGLYTMAQTVIVKEDLDKDNLFKLFKLARDHGAHEVKILEPILSGCLLTDNNLKHIFYSQDDREQLIHIQHKANAQKDFPKITSFAYTESEEKYGCGAGTQHSYINASGQLYPCDFVPMAFGSVKETNIKQLWKEMNQVIGKPKIGCFAQRINREVYEQSGGILPLNKEQSTQLCRSHQSDRFPQYYRKLQ